MAMWYAKVACLAAISSLSRGSLILENEVIVYEPTAADALALCLELFM
jgi:hypothetical protein